VDEAPAGANRAHVCEKWLPLWRLIVRHELLELRERAAMVSAAIIERLKLMYGPELSTLTEPEHNSLLFDIGHVDQF